MPDSAACTSASTTNEATPSPTTVRITGAFFVPTAKVNAVPMKVMSLDDIMVTKLLALDEHELDYERSLEFARSLRERIDWLDVRRRTRDSPYAKAFFTMVEELGVVPRRHI